MSDKLKTATLLAMGLFLSVLSAIRAPVALGQVAPSAAELSGYTGLLAAAAKGDVAAINRLASTAGSNVDVRDRYQRTPLHVATYARQRDAIRALAKAGADINAKENDRYDAVTIAAVADDVPTLKLLLELGASAKQTTSRYDGTALIAAAHLGHDEVVKLLIGAGAPLDHVNNLGWTALIESIVLGNGGPRHVETLRAIVTAGADVNLADRSGRTPLQLARMHGFAPMIEILQRAGGRP